MAVYEKCRQASYAINLEVHSQRRWGTQGPNPPAFPGLTQARIMVIYLIYDHDSHICPWVCIFNKVCYHRTVFSPPVHDIQMTTINSAVKGLPSFTHILLATPPACNKIYYTGRLAGGPYHHSQLFSSCVAEESIRGQSPLKEVYFLRADSMEV